MLKHLLIADGYPKNISVGEAAIDALLGFCVVLLGIAILVFVIFLLGKVMTAITKKKTTKKADTKVEVAKEEVVNEDLGELNEETIAVITAAITAVYQKENRNLEFTVKRIKRI